MSIIDTHVHLYDVPDVGAVLRAAAKAGVSDVVALGVDTPSNQKHLSFCAERARLPAAQEACPRVHLALGLHPGNIVSPESMAQGLAFIRATLLGPQAASVVAIGECGLDYAYKWVRKDEVKRQEQRDLFQQQINLAVEFKRPVALHSRAAWKDCLELLQSSGIEKAVFHWYSGPLGILKNILDAGYYISFTPAIEYSTDMRAAATYAPMDQVMVETDTPVAYPPQGTATKGSGEERPERVVATPQDVWRSVRELALLKGVDEAKILVSVNASARAFFNI